MSKPRVLIFVDYYLPGYKAGGPIASVSRMVRHLGAEYELSIVTRDRDLGDTHPYQNIETNKWIIAEDSRIYYASPAKLSIENIARLVEDAQPEVIYLNSYFSVITRRLLALRRTGRLGKAKIALAPRGEFSEGALNLKRLRKKLYLTGARTIGLTKGIVWHVSTEHESRDVRRSIGDHAKTIVEAPDLLETWDRTQLPDKQPKMTGAASFVWLSRLSPMKNLHFALDALREVRGDVEFSLYGPIEDKTYWQQCQLSIDRLPSNIKVVCRGGISPERVIPTLAPYHFFLFPTLGENFGHVISEALSSGCPVIVSDRTPWRDLEEHSAGWVLPLDKPDRWKTKIQACVDMDAEGFESYRVGALSYIESLHSNQRPSKNSKVFTEAIAA